MDWVRAKLGLGTCGSGCAGAAAVTNPSAGLAGALRGEGAHELERVRPPPRCECDSAAAPYHEDCLSYAARAGLSEEDWRCPVCTGVFPRRAIGNPQAGKAQACAKRRARKRARGEAAPSAGRAAKRATYARSKAAGTAPPRLR